MEDTVLDDPAAAEGAFGQAARERAVNAVKAELASLCEDLAEGLAMGLDEGREMVGGAMSEFLADFLDSVRAKGSRPAATGIVMLPLLVHGAETGDPDPALPVAVAHLLWWAAARHLDDLTDAPAPPSPRDGAEHRAAGAKVLTALAVGGHLPVRLVAELPVPDAVRAGLVDELSRCCLDAVDGQLRDLAGRPSSATPESVLRSYAGKTGAPYAMAAASAARLAGAAPGRAARWRGYGRTLGVLRQLVNDHRDLASGRYEDLANGTATYPLVHLLTTLPAPRRRAVLALHEAARDSAAARAELASRMLDEEVADGCAASVAPLIARAHALLDGLGGKPDFVQDLHALVDAAAHRLPGLSLAVA
ncbi:polyprenyl synthetase family protein [Actinomadura fibrosa]|uniref:Polyprenyl synthetase family protein n=1 Tax=Actinomadura fibrosa TaxID=111802 RepID=A0ABW2XSZ3_9ACTN|nr:polyprenyl synthetase family protein [Actinomadura fibrosa]